MNSIAWLAKWLLRAAIFFTLFAFALNNPHLVRLNFFFGQHWSAPVVLVVLVVFACGVAVGAIGMSPRWWRRRQNRVAASTASGLSSSSSSSALAASSATSLPPGLHSAHSGHSQPGMR